MVYKKGLAALSALEIERLAEIIVAQGQKIFLNFRLTFFISCYYITVKCFTKCFFWGDADGQ